MATAAIETAEDLLNLTGGDTTAGLTTVVFWGYAHQVKTWPKPKGGSTVDEVTADAAVVLEPGAKIGKLKVTFNENDLKYKLAGQIGSKGYKQDLSLYRAGQLAEFLGFTTKVKNKELFFIIPDKNGNQYFLGSELIPCLPSEGEGSLGNNVDAKNGNSITITSESRIPLLIYPFPVPLTPFTAI